MATMVQNEYLACDNLHWRPISARFNRLVFYSETAMERGANKEKWHGHVVSALAKGVLGIGVLVVVPIALIESAAMFVFASLGLIFNGLCCGNQSEWLQKYSLKTMAYSLHAFAECLRSLFCFARLNSFGFHTANLLLDHAIYLGSAFAVHELLGAWIDHKANRELPAEHYVQVGVNLLLDDFRLLGGDVLCGLQRDFGGTINDLAQEPLLDNFLTDHPEHREFIEEFNFQGLRDPAYRQEALTHISETLQELTELPPEQLNPIVERAGEAGGPLLRFLGVQE
jgi:hypothetical protein